MAEVVFCKNVFCVALGDITALAADAIVNAANTSLLGGGGVDGAIHRAAGPELLEECRTLGGCKTGEAKATRGYHLPASYVVHTVGPVWRNGKSGEQALLASCYRNSLQLADKLECKSIVFPAISTGAYRFPPAETCRIALQTSQDTMQTLENITKVTFCCFQEPLADRYIKELANLVV